MAACSCNAISKNKINLPLHGSMYQILELELFWISESCQWSE